MTNVRFSHNDTKLISTGGADMSVMVWTYSGGIQDASSGTGEPTAMVPSSSTYLSEESDTDSEEEGSWLRCHCYII